METDIGMLILSYISCTLFITTVVFLYFYDKEKRISKEASTKLEELKIAHALNSQDAIEYKTKSEKLDAEHNNLLVRKTEAETKLSSLNEQIRNLQQDLKKAIDEKENLIEEKNEYRRKEELAQQRLQAIEAEMQNWQKTKEEQEKAVTASILEAGSKLSSKLLDDHKRESETAKKESEKLVKETTENLMNQHKSLIESVTTLHDNVKETKKQSDVVHRALLSPSGAGSLGEITLENIFKNSGLTKDIDYKMQYSVNSSEGRGLRPDAVVYLPDNNVMVIDSKASKFFLELGEENIDTSNEKEISARLKSSMNENLKNLASREYSKAIEDDAGKALARVYMFLPTEAALDKLRKVDPQFIEKAWNHRILPVGPTGLLNVLIDASRTISNAKQEENAKLIIAKVKDLLNSVATLHDYASNVGKGLKRALDNYDGFAKSFNRTFMSKANSLGKLGIDAQKIKNIKGLPQYGVYTLEFTPTAIEGEFSEESDIIAVEVEEETKELEVVA
jgi:DNA recombination protein RmuC